MAAGAFRHSCYYKSQGRRPEYMAEGQAQLIAAASVLALVALHGTTSGLDTGHGLGQVLGHGEALQAAIFCR